MFPFLTAYDPLGSSNGSIDPLGALQSYGALADMLLPGVTTVTTRSRYVTMLCAALANAEAYQRFLPAASGLAQRRIAVEPFERLWALACVAARQAGSEKAADGLRGVTYAEDRYRAIASDGKRVDVDFKLLKYQGRTGAVGTYWTALIGGQLIDADTGALTAEGRELAMGFPELPLPVKDCQRLADPQRARGVTLTLNELQEWGRRCHLAAAGKPEQTLLGEALIADDRRDSICRALSEMSTSRPLPKTWNISSIKRLRQTVGRIPRADALGLPIVLDAILVTERFHEAVLCVFETLLWWGTERAGQPVQRLLSDGAFRQKTDHCVSTAQALCDFRRQCERSEIRDAIDSLVAFSNALVHCNSSNAVVDGVLQRHHQVQSGKLDGGMPKRDWIGMDGSKLLRPSPRFQRTAPPAAAEGSALTHPYRLEQFVDMLRENDVLPQPKTASVGASA